MKKLTFSLFLLLSGIGLSAQTYSNALIVDSGGNRLKVSSLEIDETNQSLEFTDLSGQSASLNFNGVQAVYEKKGTYFWAGLGGGFASGLLAGLAIGSGNDSEAWHGAGPVILAGTLAGGVVGALIPRYKAIDLSGSTTKRFQIEADPLAMRLAIRF